jgi:lipid-A-disaccharide synthase
VRHLPRIIRRVHATVAAVLRERPDVLVIIDSPGFTHSVARRVARARPELPVIGYVSPSVWAWRPGRAPRMRAYVDHVLALLPFEPAVHERLGGPPCTYIGHPLVERLGELNLRPGERPELAERRVLLVLPGSRDTEVDRLMRPFGEAAALISEAVPGIEIELPAVPHLRAKIEAAAARWKVAPKIVHGEAEKFAAFRRAHAALAASGTVTLELGLAGVPTVVAYRVDPVARLLKRFLRIPSIVLTNLVLKENVVPEFLDGAGTPAVLARQVLPLLAESPERAAQISALARLREAMQVKEAPSDRAAAIVIEAAENGSGRRLGRASAPA